MPSDELLHADDPDDTARAAHDDGRNSWLVPARALRSQQRQWSRAERVAASVLWLVATAICFALLPHNAWRMVIVIPVTLVVATALVTAAHDIRAARRRA